MDSIPRPYLRWLREQEWLSKWLSEEIDQVLAPGASTTDDPDESFEDALKALKESKDG